MMFSSTLVIRTTTLISLFIKWMMPINNMVMEARVLQLDNLTYLLRQVLSRIGTPLHTQSLEFLWRSGVQALYLLESHLFPEQTPQTPTEMSTPAGNAQSFRFLVHDTTFQAHVDELLPSWNTVCQFLDWLNQASSAMSIPTEIIDAVWDASLILENLGLVFGIDFCTRNSNTAPPDVGGTADTTTEATASGSTDQVPDP